MVAIGISRSNHLYVLAETETSGAIYPFNLKSEVYRAWGALKTLMCREVLVGGHVESVVSYERSVGIHS